MKLIISILIYDGYNNAIDRASYFNAGAIAIKLVSPKGESNMFLFYPAVDGSGGIGSCAIYGSQLSVHKASIERSLSLFGLHVESVEWDEGVERFLDVTLQDY